VHIIMNGLLAALLNISVFVVLTETGAVTYSIAGQGETTNVTTFHEV
jgi:hypothetical protein